MNRKKVTAVVLVIVMSLGSTVSAFADRVDSALNRPYVSLGADLKSDERQIVLDLLGLSEYDLDDADVVEVTNEDEHKYLDEYMDASVIGTRALSSVLVVGKEEGYGIHVTTNNISYCTTGMYRNALITAGIEDADIKVAGPFSLSGTAALVGAVKAYEVMTGDEVDEDSLDTATNELVVTGEISDSVGDSASVEEMIAAIKQKVVSEDVTDKEQIYIIIGEVSNEFNITLTDDQKAKIASVMEKVSDLDLDTEALENQAKDLYDKLQDMDLDLGIDTEEAKNFFQRIIDAIVDFFKNLFN